MFSQYFGNYLLNQRLLSTAQLRKALDYSNSTQVKIGILAMHAGYLSAEQVEEIQNIQRTIDMRFGEVAVLKGYLTGNQVAHLLETQARGHLLLSQAINDLNYMSLAELQSALHGYKDESGLTARQFSALRTGDTDAIVRVFLDFSATGREDAYYDYVSLMIRNMLRFLGELAFVEAPIHPQSLQLPVFVAQSLSGGMELYTGISMIEDVFFNTAVRFSQMPLQPGTTLADDAVREFLNLHNGLFLVNMSNQGTELNMMPAAVIRNQRVDLSQAYVIPFHLGLETLNIIISSQPMNVIEL